MTDNWQPSKEETALIYSFALQNVLEYGEAQMGSIMGKLSQTFDMKQYGKLLPRYVIAQVNKANSLLQKQGIEAVREELIGLDASKMERLEREKVKVERVFPDLLNVKHGNFKVRFAPNPNAPLTVGHMRGVLINKYYADKYDGEFILRFDDTSTDVKPPIIEAYIQILKDIKWLTGKAPDDVLIASDRMNIYYDYADQLISMNGAYMCNCKNFKELKDARIPCPHRGLSVEENIELFNKMKQGDFGAGEWVLRARTDLDAPNPAHRDFVLFRVQRNAHPRTGDSYKAWPMLDFQSAIDDHLSGVTHIIRGIDLQDSTAKQKILYSVFDWDYPETTYWGRVKILDQDDNEVRFSSSQYAKDIAEGKFTGWDDKRLYTVQAFKNRGYTPDALLNWWLEYGLTRKPITVSMKTLDTLQKRGGREEVMEAEERSPNLMNSDKERVPRFIYHATPLKYWEKIQKQGKMIPQIGYLTYRAFLPKYKKAKEGLEISPQDYKKWLSGEIEGAKIWATSRNKATIYGSIIEPMTYLEDNAMLKIDTKGLDFKYYDYEEYFTENEIPLSAISFENYIMGERYREDYPDYLIYELSPEYDEEIEEEFGMSKHDEGYYEFLNTTLDSEGIGYKYALIAKYPEIDLTAFEIPQGLEPIGRNHITIVSGKALKPVKKIVKENKENLDDLPMPPQPILGDTGIAIREVEGEKRETYFMVIENQEEFQDYANLVCSAVGIKNPEPNRFFHLSIANNQGGDSFKSVGDIMAKDLDETEEFNAINVSNTTLSNYARNRHRKFDHKQARRHNFGMAFCEECGELFMKNSPRRKYCYGDCAKIVHARQHHERYANMTDDERDENRKYQRKYVRQKKANWTDEEREEFNRKQRESARKRKTNWTDGEWEKNRKKWREYRHKRVANWTEEEWEEHNRKQRERWANRTDEEREEYNRKQRERYAKRK